MLSETSSTLVEDEAAPDANLPLRVLRLFGASSIGVRAQAIDDGQVREQAARPYARAFIYGPETADLFERATDTVYPNGGDTSLPPQIREGWRTYNFEVEDFHTYIAGGLRVHNTSLLDLIPEEASEIRPTDTDGDGRLDTATYRRPGGIEETIHGRDRDGDGNTDLIDRTAIIPREGYLGPGDVVRWREFYEGNNTAPSEQEIVGIDYAGGSLQGEEAGRTLGSALGSALGGHNVFAQVGSATIAATLLQNVGEFLHKSIDLSLLAMDGLPVTPLEAAVADTFRDFGLDLVGNAQIQVINGLSSVLVGEIADALNLEGFERGVFSTVGNTVTNQVLSNVANMLGRPLPGTVVNANVNLLSGFDTASMVSNLANSLGGYFGSQLGTLAVAPHNQQSALFGSATAAVGSYVGGTLAGATLATAFSIVPVIGTLIGAFAGQALGNLVGNALFDDDRIARYTLSTDTSGRVQYGDPFTQDGASLDLSRFIASTATDSINSIFNSAGARIDVNQAFNPFTVGWYVDNNNQKIMYAVDQRYQTTYNVRETQGVIAAAVNYAVENSELGGSDIILRRAYHVSHRAGLAQLAFDLQVAKDFEEYQANTTLINTLISDNPRSEFAVGWIATLERARELGLHRAVDFNAMEYLASYADLRQVYGSDTEAATRHFINYGIDEGRRSSFDAIEYLAANPGLAQSLGGIDRNTAADDYIRVGQSRNRPVHFDYLRYLASNPGLAQQLGGVDEEAADRHYINSGYYENRPTQTFDYMQYLAANPGLAQQLGGINAEAAERNYIIDGYRQGRPTQFDALQYLAANPGLAQSLGGINATTAASHYITAGYREGRLTTFDTDAYIASYADLARAFGTDRAAAERHVIENGSRGITFDPFGYLELNPDLRAAFGNDLGAAARHYSQTGRNDGIHHGSFTGRASGLTIYGGAGIDTVSYVTSSVGVIIDLAAQQSSNGTGGDLFVSIENAIGSGANDDIRAGAGTRRLEGRGGDDRLLGAANGATLDGGAGIDTVSYVTSSVGVIIDLAAQQSFNGTNGDVFISIENAIGSNADDDMRAGAGTRLLRGRGGDDRLLGAANGATLDGGAGIDTVSYVTSAVGVFIDLAAQETWNGTNGDHLVSIENALGSNGNDDMRAGADTRLLRGRGGDDRLSGAANGATLDGGAGNDSLIGGTGNDTLLGGQGNDYIDGGTGTDLAVFSGRWADYRISRNDSGSVRLIDRRVENPDGTDIVTNVEYFQFSDQVLSVGALIRRPAADDLNGDGTSDLILQSGDSVVDWIIGGGQYVSSNALGGAGSYLVRAMGDLNGDGTSDVILQEGANVVNWTMREGRVQSGAMIGQAGAYTVRAIGDVNGDGTGDIILQSGSSVVAWTMRDGRYQSGSLIGDAGSYTVVGTGDFNGDGTIDILLQNGSSVVAWMMINGQVVSGNVVGEAGAYTVVGTGDFNRDGTTDVLLQNGDTVVNWIVGNSRAVSGNVIGSAVGFTVVGTGDYNGDGTADIALQNGASVVDWLVSNGQYAGGNGIGNAGSYVVV